MLHPVPPPAPLPIVEPVPSANAFPYASDTEFPSVLINQTDSQEQKQESPPVEEIPQISNVEEAESPSGLSTFLNSTRDNLSGKTLATPNTPETFPPEFSPFTASQSAANLGEPQTVGYSQKLFDAFSNIPKVQVVAQKATPQEPENNISVEQFPDRINISADQPDYIPSSQPVENTIEFKSRNPNNGTSTPSSIEFKSPSEPAQQSTPTPPARQRTVEVISDRQEYDEQRRIITAEGNVVVRFDGAVVDADRLQVNLDNLIAVGSGNVALTRGDQVLRGERFSYNFIQDNGEIENGSGEIFVPSAQTDLALSPTGVTPGEIQRPLSDRVRRNQPLSGITSPGGINFTLGGGEARNIPAPEAGGKIKRLRFQAQRIEFYPRGWQAEDVRITNDPFSPPELELRASQVTATRESPLVETITTQGQRLVFDQKFSLPIPVNKQTLDRFERDASPFYVSPGFDGGKRGGLFVERGFTPVDNEQTRWRITPQLFVQKALEEGTGDLAALFGLTSRINAVLSPRATLEGSGELTSFDFNKIDQNLRGNLRMTQALSDVNPHILNLEYSYRDRLYNGTLGFQTVQSSIGGLISSPLIPIGNTGVNLNYQAGVQYINANTDRLDLLEADRTNDRISLGRLQGSASLSKGFLLWQGKPLPPTATEGLKYTPNPVVPYVQTIASVTGTSSYYTNNENQSTLTGTVGLIGQFGNFSRPYLDYTAFNVTYSQGLNSGLSPFLFDRSVDNKVLGAGISQQIYGPFRLGFQTAINLDTGKETSTDYILEYSRRTYGLTLRYNPVLELGGFSIRISDFNWTGGTDPFSGREVKPVVDGVRQNN
ncbi:DUF3769 domain-containing protein [Nodularia sphaerocarpa]|uniref:DUF3769 domain-containing protein n=2 Tax=Nodularia sphaerocarpa TaxID=137816 RepID=UPI001EFA8099|nr:DUF3769 domain-containing protein [Nodularia sphaerocarpa]MDB9372510.1 DUF3769 domain-containing protein [Nodularia sphaerocarpa CS-585]ULP71271.1 LPS-assembly protein LptD [Nodularia sphaerocarpa UHCC 0038]